MRNIEMASRNDLKRRGDNITKSPLNKNATLYLAALKSMVVPMGWAEIKRSVEIATKHRLNPRRFQEILNTLQDALLIKQSGAVYAVTDPMLKNVLLQPSKKGRSSRGEIKGRYGRRQSLCRKLL